MKTRKKLIVGILLLALTAAFSIPLQSAKVYAREANEQQLNALARNLKFSEDKETITGKIGDTTITFTKKVRAPVTIYYEAENLDCNGDKARIENVQGDAPLTTGSFTNQEPGLYLVAKPQQGNNCGESKSIKTTLNPSAAPSITDANAGDSEGTGDGDSCETTNSGPLGWILCPIIDLAANFTSFVFENFVQPFLEDVPVTTNPSDPTYKAWQQFRLIGNIVLVGTMLAVVYAQVRGGR